MGPQASTDTAPPAVTPDDWQVDRLDLDAYLDRVSYSGDRAPTVGTLTALHRAHLATVPFENLDIILGRGIDPDLAAVQDKIVGRRRGGYCFEHNVLFGAALQRLGFDVGRHVARIGDPTVKVVARSHLALLVSVDGQRWLADVGFGSGPLEPVPLTGPGVVRQGAWEYRVLAGPDAGWRLQGRWEGDWRACYTLTPELAHPVDVEVANHYTATHPASPFVTNPAVVRKDETAVRALRGRQLTVVYPDGTQEARDIPDGGYGAALAEFGLTLPDAEVAALSARIDESTSDDGAADDG